MQDYLSLSGILAVGTTSLPKCSKMSARRSATAGRGRSTGIRSRSSANGGSWRSSFPARDPRSAASAPAIRLLSPRDHAGRRDHAERPLGGGRSEPDGPKRPLLVEGEDDPSDDDVVFGEHAVLIGDARDHRSLEPPVPQERAESRPSPVALEGAEESG